MVGEASPRPPFSFCSDSYLSLSVCPRNMFTSAPGNVGDRPRGRILQEVLEKRRAIQSSSDWDIRAGRNKSKSVYIDNLRNPNVYNKPAEVGDGSKRTYGSATCLSTAAPSQTLMEPRSPVNRLHDILNKRLQSWHSEQDVTTRTTNFLLDRLNQNKPDGDSTGNVWDKYKLKNRKVTHSLSDLSGSAEKRTSSWSLPGILEDHPWDNSQDAVTKTTNFLLVGILNQGLRGSTNDLLGRFKHRSVGNSHESLAETAFSNADFGSENHTRTRTLLNHNPEIRVTGDITPVKNNKNKVFDSSSEDESASEVSTEIDTSRLKAIPLSRVKGFTNIQNTDGDGRQGFRNSNWSLAESDFSCDTDGTGTEPRYVSRTMLNMNYPGRQVTGLEEDSASESGCDSRYSGHIFLQPSQSAQNTMISYSGGEDSDNTSAEASYADGDEEDNTDCNEDLTDDDCSENFDTDRVDTKSICSTKAFNILSEDKRNMIENIMDKYGIRRYHINKELLTRNWDIPLATEQYTDAGDRVDSDGESEEAREDICIDSGEHPSWASEWVAQTCKQQQQEEEEPESIDPSSDEQLIPFLKFFSNQRGYDSVSSGSTEDIISSEEQLTIKRISSYDEYCGHFSDGDSDVSSIADDVFEEFLDSNWAIYRSLYLDKFCLFGQTSRHLCESTTLHLISTHVEKGNDMLEEASMISQSGNFDEVSGIRDIAKELKARLQSFTERLENVRENIESASKCYHLLDKTYEWALNAMKYVASMKMDSSTTLQGVEKLLTSIDLYLREHPPIDVATFDLMLEIAMNLKNEKLHDQCKVAKARCMETDQLLKVRQSTFKRAREKMLLEQQQRRRNSMGYGGLVTFRERHQASCRQWEPHEELVLSTPGVVLRRRSYAGKPSAPLYSPAAQAFKDKEHDMNLLEYEEHLFSEGLITEDMSDRIVASLPKTLGDGTLRTSRDSLRGSRESLQGSCENLSRDQKSSSLPRDVPPSIPSQFNQSGTTLNKHNKPHRKIMRRTNSAMQFGEHEDKSSRDSRRSGHTLSMITGSSESLPSMPEEEELNTNNGDREKFAWSPVPVNTHLMFRQSRGLVSHQSMADLRLTEEDVKRRRTLQMIMSEMIQTERDYVRALQFVIENYVSEVLRDDVPQPLRGKRNVIFGNLENIYQFHSQYFLAELEQCESNPYAVGSCFLQHRTEFYLYSLYNKNKPKSDALMIEYGSKFFKQKQFELQDRMDLGSYLLKPVQRMGKYSLLLKQVIKECPDTDQDYGDLKNALEMVKFQLRHGNDLLAMDSLRDFDVNLQEQGQLLRQDEFLVWQGRRKCLRHIFLFEDLVLFSKTRRNATGHDIYVYKNSIKTSDIGLTETVGESGYKFEIWFRRRKYGETYVLQAHSTEVKNAWVREISRLLWKQAIKNRENRMCEMANMGIGNKPCLDIKPSEDNINDRFVNIAVSGRVPRARNSIAVSSADHIKNGNKRPHSIISVSSTSSSNSSQSSSSYGQNSTHDSSGISRSFTICSNESGIVTDMSTDDQSPSQCLPRLGVQHSDSGASLDTMSFSNSTPNSPCGLPSMQELAESNV